MRVLNELGCSTEKLRQSSTWILALSYWLNDLERVDLAFHSLSLFTQKFELPSLKCAHFRLVFDYLFIESSMFRSTVLLPLREISLKLSDCYLGVVST